jgi:hypothetical protein
MRRRIAVGLLVGLLCFVLAVFAQRRLDHKHMDNLAFLSYGVAGVLFAAAFGGVALERSTEPGVSSPSDKARLSRSAGVVTALLLGSLLGCLDFGDNRFRPVGVLVWGGGLLLSLLYLYVIERPKAFGERVSAVFSRSTLGVPRIWLGLGIAVLVGAALRLQQLDAIPADIGWDLPYNYTDVSSILSGQYRIFFPANQGREGMFFYLIALVARFAPLSHFSIKLTSAIVGIVTIPLMFLLGRRLYGPSVGLAAAFFLAVNRWHVVLSRSGFRVILLPLFTILLLHLVARALQTRRPFDFAAAGLVMGLGLHTYTAYFFAVLAVFAGLVLYAFSARRPDWRALWPLLTLMVAFALVAYAPLGRFAIEHPEQYLQRVALQRRLLTADPNRPRMTLPLLLENVRTSLLMYHVYGDSNVRFNLPFYRHFGFVSGILLVLGLLYVARRWRQGSNSLLLVMFFFLIAPMTLAMFPHEMPNVFRAAGTIGPGLLLVTVPLMAVGKRVEELSHTYPPFDFSAKLRIWSGDEAYQFIWRVGRRGMLVLVPILATALLIGLEYGETRQFYFHDFVNVLPDRQNVSIAKEMARQMEAFGDLSSCFIKVWPHWFDGRALQTYLRRPYGAWNPEFTDLAVDQPPLSSIQERGLFILHPDDAAGLETLRTVFPSHATVVHYLPDATPAFILVYVER